MTIPFLCRLSQPMMTKNFKNSTDTHIGKGSFIILKRKLGVASSWNRRINTTSAIHSKRNNYRQNMLHQQSISSSSSSFLHSYTYEHARYPSPSIVPFTSRFISSNSKNKRPFRILGLQQVAVGSTELGPLRHLWMDIFGLKKVNTHTSEKENVMEDILHIAAVDTNDDDSTIIPVELDLMCPIDKNKSPKVCIYFELF